MEIFEVGGCVRDHIMCKEPNDIDFVVVGSTPQEMLDNGFALVGESFPVFLGKDGNEYALARTERKTGKGYTGFITEHNPNVTLESDLFRRDITINAIARDVKTGKLIDPFGGQQDIKDKQLKHVSNAFAEDPVRVLRIARFNARFGPEWQIVHETKCIIAEMVDDGMLEELTPERVWKETEKALSSDNPMLFFDALYEVGALVHIFPEMQSISLKQLEENLLSWVDMKPMNDANINFALWAILLERNGVNVEEFSQRLKIPNEYFKMINVIKDLEIIVLTFINPLVQLMQLFKNPFITNERLGKILNVLVGDCGITHMILECKEAFDSVNFESIDDEGKQSLKGHQIGSEIDRIRAEKISSIIN